MFLSFLLKRQEHGEITVLMSSTPLAS
jgi:hypothetical protein